MRIGSQEFPLSPEIIEEKRGVGIFLVTSDGYFLTVEETRTNRHTAKVEGMRSIPMETLEPGETDEDALYRALGNEEVKSEAFRELKPRAKLCAVQIAPGVWLHAYLIIVPSIFQVEPGNAPDVTGPGWNHINELLGSTPGNRKFRPGNREVIKSYLEFRQNTTFQPGLYFRCEDEIPQEVFDEMDSTRQA